MSTATVQDPWEVEVKQGGDGNFEVCPAKNQAGHIIGLIDMGHHRVDRKDDKTGEMKTRDERKLAIFYEVTSKQTNGDPFVLVERFTYSMNDRSNLYALVKNLTGATPAANSKFSVASLIGMPVMVNVTHGKSKADKAYASVSSVAQFPEGIPVPPRHHEPFSWSVMSGEPFPANLDYLPWVFGTPVKDLVAQSREMKERQVASARATQAADGFDANDPPF